jgi:hypothetical protein
VTARLHRRTGVEIELMAPPGLSRRTLAQDLAARCGGLVRPVWHRDSEPSLVPGLGQFLRLTQGFEVRRADGDLLCTLVDDITLMAGLDPGAAAAPGWFRILTDDVRLAGLLAAHSDPGGDLATALDATARLWGTATRRHGDVRRLDDATGATIALAAPLGGERERPCEIITPPLTGDHRAALRELLVPARELGFTVPHEAAVHLHLDGAPFRRPHALANVVRLFALWREPLRALVQTNPACRRLAPLPAALVHAATRTTGTPTTGTPTTGTPTTGTPTTGTPTTGTPTTGTGGPPTRESLRTAAADGGLTKFFDVNLTQLLTDTPVRDTLEVRILPGAVDAGAIIDRAALVELLLDRCLHPEPFPDPPADPDTAVTVLLDVAAGVLAGREEPQPGR